MVLPMKVQTYFSSGWREKVLGVTRVVASSSDETPLLRAGTTGLGKPAVAGHKANIGLVNYA